MTTRLLARLTALRRAYQRVAEVTGDLAWADRAADLDAPIARLWRRARRGRV